MRALSILPIYLATALAFQPSRRMALKTPVRPVVRHAVPTMSFATTTAPVIGALLTNGMYLAGVPAVQAARKKGSLGALNPLPFAMLLGNCVGWTSYGFLAEDYYLVAGNMPGILLGLWMYATALKVLLTSIGHFYSSITRVFNHNFSGYCVFVLPYSHCLLSPPPFLPLILICTQVGTPGQRKLLNRVVKGLSGLFVGSIFTLALVHSFENRRHDGCFVPLHVSILDLASCDLGTSFVWNVSCMAIKT